MKKIVPSLLLLLFVVKSFSQSPALSKDYYLEKSKTQKTIGWVMLVGGVAMTTIGLVITDKQINDDPLGYAFTDKGTGSLILTILGMGTAVVCIPFFISSKKNARKAATISFKNQKILFPLQNTFVLKTQPALTLKIELL